MDRARRLQATSKELRRLRTCRTRLFTKTSPTGPPLPRFRLLRKTAPGSVEVQEPKRHRSACFVDLEELDIPSDDEEVQFVDGILPLFTDPDLRDTLTRDEIYDALTWPVLEPQAEFDYSDPLGNGVVMG